MKIKLHEVELEAKDPAASRKFYVETLGLKLNPGSNEGLNVFDSGWPGVDFDTSSHRPGKTVISFLTDDLPGYISRLREKGIKIEGPKPSHLGMLVASFEDPDGHLVYIQGLTPESPAWLRQQFGF